MGDERDQIRELLPIETLVGEHVALKRTGRNLTGLCPFHKEKSPSFVVSPERGSFHCFGCGAGGDIFRFYMLTHKVEFPEALRALAARTGVELDPQAGRQKAAEARAHEVLASVTLYFQQSLAGSAGRQAREYLAGRGLTRETIERFALGYLPDWGEGLRRELPRRGVSEQELIDAAVLLPSDQGREPFCPFHGRLIFPIRDQQGRVCGFGGRILGEGQPKYLNSRQGALFDKSAVLYTIDRAADAIRAAGEAVIVEGYMDALRAHQDGFANVVASLGTAITVRQLSLLARLTGRVVLALDADPAGARAAAEAAVRAGIALRQSRPEVSTLDAALGRGGRQALEIRIARLPAGRDPDEVIAGDPQTWRAAIAGAVPAMEYLFDLVLAALDRTTPTFVQDLLGALLPLVGQLPGVGLQQPYLERLAALTRIDTAALRGELARLRGEARRRENSSRARGGAGPAAAPIPAGRRAGTNEHRLLGASIDPAVGGAGAEGVRRDPQALIEAELLHFLLRQSPLDEAVLGLVGNLALATEPRRRVLAAVLAAHRGAPAPQCGAAERDKGSSLSQPWQPRSPAAPLGEDRSGIFRLPDAATIAAMLDGEALALVEDLFGGQVPRPGVATTPAPQREAAEREKGSSLSGSPPLIEPAKVPIALRAYLSRLERLAQSRRLREQGELLDQVDPETARALLAPTQDLISSRHALTERMLEEQAQYHLR